VRIQQTRKRSPEGERPLDEVNGVVSTPLIMKNICILMISEIFHKLFARELQLIFIFQLVKMDFKLTKTSRSGI